MYKIQNKIFIQIYFCAFMILSIPDTFYLKGANVNKMLTSPDLTGFAAYMLTLHFALQHVEWLQETRPSI